MEETQKSPYDLINKLYRPLIDDMLENTFKTSKKIQMMQEIDKIAAGNLQLFIANQIVKNMDPKNCDILIDNLTRIKNEGSGTI